MNGKITVAIADLEPIVHEGVRSLIEKTEDLECVEYVTSLPAAMDAVRRSSPAVLLLDECFGRHRVLAFLNELKIANCRTAVVVWRGSLSAAEAAQLVRAGAMGITTKSISPTDLLNCVRTVASGEKWLPEALCAGYQAHREVAWPSLTKREQEVLEKVIEGETTRSVALAMGIQPGTVKVHLKRIFEKTGIHSRFGLSLATHGTKSLASGA